MRARFCLFFVFMDFHSMSPRTDGATFDAVGCSVDVHGESEATGNRARLE